LRLRVPPPADGGALAEAVRRVPGVQGSTWSPRTRGLLVLYEGGSSTSAAVFDAMSEHGQAPEPSPLIEALPDARLPLARAVNQGVSELDGGVRRITRGLVGLGALFPIVLVLWSVRQVATGRATPLSWTSALWYAHALFRDYNTPAS